MPARSGGVPLDQLRREVRTRVEAASLRQVAREVGMSPTGLQKFLDGASPYTSTQRKLERWHVRESASYRAEPSLASALAAVRILTQHLPEPRRRKAAESLVRELESAHGRSRPDWLRELAASLRSAGGA